MAHVARLVSTVVTAAVAVLMIAGGWCPSGAVAAPAEGLTPFGFLMARAYGEPAENTVMRYISFKPSDGPKFREMFEKKHGPRGRDLIDSLGRGSYTSTTMDPKTLVAEFGPLTGNSLPVENALEYQRRFNQ